MSNGDITAIRPLGRVTLPGGGHTVDGLPVNHKVMVWGSITCTWADTGIDLATQGGVRALGVETLDFVDFFQHDTDQTVMNKDALTLINLDTVDNLIFMLEDVGAATESPPDAGDALVLRFMAVGDGFTPELT